MRWDEELIFLVYSSSPFLALHSLHGKGTMCKARECDAL